MPGMNCFDLEDKTEPKTMSTYPKLHLIEHCKWVDIRSGDMLWTIFVILLVLWLLGFGFHVAGSLIHLLLVVAVVVLLLELITGRRAAL